MRKILIFIVFFASFFQTIAQKECGTASPKVFIKIPKEKKEQLAALTLPIVVKTYITIFANNDGTNQAVPDSIAKKQFENMVDIYKLHHICFMLIDIRVVKNTDLNDHNKDEEDELNEFMVENCLNMFVHNSLKDTTGADIGGTAYDIPNTFLSLDRDNLLNASNISTMAHETGHCLGLIHTHENSAGTRFENVDRTGDCSNCEEMGDLLCDTAASDIEEDADVDSNCNYIKGGIDPCGVNYNPDTENIMAYGNLSCRNHFSAGQGERMRFFLDESLYKNIIVKDEISKTPAIPLLNLNIDFGVTIETAKNELNISSHYGNEFNVTGSAKVFLQAKKVTLGKGTHFNPASNGRISVKSNIYCN